MVSIMKALFRAKQSKLLLLLLVLAMLPGMHAARSCRELPGLSAGANQSANAAPSPEQGASRPWRIATQGASDRTEAILQDENNLSCTEKISSRSKGVKAGKARPAFFSGIPLFGRSGPLTGFDLCSMMSFTLSAKNSASVTIRYMHDQDGSKEV